MPRKETKRDRLAAEIAARGLQRIDEAAALTLREALAPVSDSTFRKLIRECGLPLDALVEGVRQDSPESLERTLVALLGEYTSRPADARKAVIQARDHARFAQRRNRNSERDEAILWMTVWLENPPVFTTWLAARKAAVTRT